MHGKQRSLVKHRVLAHTKYLGPFRLDPGGGKTEKFSVSVREFLQGGVLFGGFQLQASGGGVCEPRNRRDRAFRFYPPIRAHAWHRMRGPPGSLWPNQG